jgi:hypothetical protein
VPMHPSQYCLILWTALLLLLVLLLLAPVA